MSTDAGERQGAGAGEEDAKGGSDSAGHREELMEGVWAGKRKGQQEGSEGGGGRAHINGVVPHQADGDGA